MSETVVPLVSVVMPVRNEEEFIRKTISSLLMNDYAPKRLEVLVVDGMSDDGTRDIVREMAQRDARLKLLDNPRRVTPVAMNIGIQNSRGEIIVIMGGHATVAPDFISQSVLVLNEHPEACCAGGIMETIGMSYTGSVIATAMSSPFGVGGGNFRVRKTEGYVATVPFGAHRRWIFDKLGLFDEELVRNQDDDFIQRMIEAGEKQYMSPAIKSKYFCRASFRKLFRQYFQYGFWRIRTIQKHGKPANIRQIIPLTFVLGWIILCLAALLWSPFQIILGCYCALYIIILFTGAYVVSREKGWKIGVLVPVAFILMHFGYGFGSLKGIWSWIIFKGRFVSSGEAFKMSR